MKEIRIVDDTQRQPIEEEIEQRNRELILINQAGQLFNSTLELDESLTTILEETRRLLQATACSVWLLDPDTGQLVCQQVTEPYGNMVKNSRLAIGQGIAGWVVQHGQSELIADTRLDPRHFKDVDKRTNLELRSILSVPLRLKKHVIGVIHAVDVVAHRFKATDLRLLESLADHAAIAIDHARLYSERKETEILLRKTNALLRRQVDELDAFAHTVAHDLKNPLSVIVSYLGYVLNSLETIPPERLRDNLKTVKESGEESISIVNALLLLSSVHSQQVSLNLVNMKDVVQAVIRRLDLMIKKYDGKIILPTEWILSLGYYPWLEEVWMNYLSNGLKYGGKSPVLEIGTRKEGDRVRYWVKDNGAGLTAEEQSHLFIEFSRVHQGQIDGHGLGLSIVKRIIDKLGGKVGVESVVGRGSTFYFTLPTSL